MLPALIPLLSLGTTLVGKLMGKSESEKSGLIATLQRFANEGDQASLEAEVQRLTMLQQSDNIQAQTTLTTINQGKGQWRDWVGNICAIALGVNFLAIPASNLVINGVNAYISPAHMDNLSFLPTGDLMTLLFGMLGLGGYEIIRNKANG